MKNSPYFEFTSVLQSHIQFSIVLNWAEMAELKVDRLDRLSGLGCVINYISRQGLEFVH